MKENSFLTDIANQFGSGESSMLDFLINILITIILSYIIGLVYSKYGNSLSNRKKLTQTFVLIAVTVMLVISIVKSSLALSLGLVGALSIVRFRTAIKEPEELVYFFVAIAIGLGMGANQRIVTLTGSAVIILYSLFFADVLLILGVSAAFLIPVVKLISSKNLLSSGTSSGGVSASSAIVCLMSSRDLLWR